MAEEYVSWLRGVEIGINHHIAAAYLRRYAQESSWREDNRGASNRDQVNRLESVMINKVRCDEEEQLNFGVRAFVGQSRACAVARFASGCAGELVRDSRAR